MSPELTPVAGAPIISSSDFHAAAALSRILRTRVTAGEYKPGQRIVEKDLKAEFGFSNGPIREALQQLVADGLAEREHFKGVRVVNLDNARVAELFRVRLALLEGAVELAAQRFDPSSLPNVARLKQDLRTVMEQRQQGQKADWVTGRFSAWLLDTADNQLLREIWVKNMQLTLVYVNAYATKSPGEKNLELTYDVIDTICAGNVKGARLAIRKLTIHALAEIGLDIGIWSGE